MPATIPATNKWLLTKQASVAQSAEQWQACDGAEQRQGGLRDSSASRVAGGPHGHTRRWRWLGKEKGRWLKYKRTRRRAEEEKKRTRELWARLGEYRRLDSPQMPLSARTAGQMSGCFYHQCVCTQTAGWKLRSPGDRTPERMRRTLRCPTPTEGRPSVFCLTLWIPFLFFLYIKKHTLWWLCMQF